MTDRLNPSPQVIELSSRDRNMAKLMPQQGMGKVIEGNFPSWNDQTVTLNSSPLEESTISYPPTGTDSSSFIDLPTLQSKAGLLLIINPIHAGNRKRVDSQTYAPGTRQALIAAARTSKRERPAVSVVSAPRENSNKAAVHAQPKLAPQLIFELPRQTFSPNEPIARASQPDRKESMRHSQQVEIARTALEYPDTVVRTLAGLAASESLQEGRGLFLADPELAIALYAARHPERVKEVTTTVAAEKSKQ